MQLSFINPSDLPSPVGGYSQAVELKKAENLVFISGQIAQMQNGEVPTDFAEQCELVWIYIARLLEACNMTLKNIVKVNTYLTHPSQSATNSMIRNKFLGDHRPALTVVVVQTLDSQWLLEIDTIAAN